MSTSIIPENPKESCLNKIFLSPKMGSFLKITGFVLTMLSIGGLLALTACRCGTTWIMDDGSYLSYESMSSILISFPSGVAGVLIFALGLISTRLGNKKRNKEKAEKMDIVAVEKEVQNKRWRSIAFIIGGAVALIGIGLLAGSLYELHHLPDMDQLEKYIIYKVGHNSNVYDDFLKFKDQIPSLEHNLIIAPFIIAAGAGLMLLGGGFSYLKRKWDQAHSQSPRPLCPESVEKEHQRL